MEAVPRTAGRPKKRPAEQDPVGGPAPKRRASGNVQPPAAFDPYNMNPQSVPPNPYGAGHYAPVYMGPVVGPSVLSGSQQMDETPVERLRFAYFGV